MPKCDLCGESFDVETKPGALFFSHPSESVREPWVRKFHICQVCERKIEELLDKGGRGDFEEWLKIRG